MIIPTVKVTDGKQTVIVNASDVQDWKAKGFNPINDVIDEAVEAEGTKPELAEARPERKKKEKKDFKDL